MAPFTVMFNNGTIIPFHSVLPPMGLAGGAAEHFASASGELQASSGVPDWIIVDRTHVSINQTSRVPPREDT